ncbi:MAG: amidohydrolase family protein [Candidatus Nanopelagicus sp.]
MLRIDSHHHIWDISVRPQTWMQGDEVKPISRTILMNELEPELEKAKIDYTVIVQTVATVDETPEFLDLSLSHPKICAVVGWLDLESDDIRPQLEKYLSHPGGKNLVSIRDLAQDKEDPNWLLRDNVVKNIHRIGEAGLTFDILTRPPQLAAAVEMVKRSPNNSFVLDHISKPYMAKGEMQPWADQISEIASYENVVVKVSGLFTEAKWSDWSQETFKPYLDHVLNSFSPSRMMFGSDWPVCLLAATYTDTINLMEEFTKNFTKSEQESFWAGTAKRAYKLKV